MIFTVPTWYQTLGIVYFISALVLSTTPSLTFCAQVHASLRPAAGETPCIPHKKQHPGDNISVYKKVSPGVLSCLWELWYLM